MTASRAGGRRKLEPDPEVRTALLSAAVEVVRENGVRALSIARAQKELGYKPKWTMETGLNAWIDLLLTGKG